MKQFLILLDDELAARLEEIAPAKSHERSEFVRRAILRSLDEELEQRTRAAYERCPDEEPAIDPAEWHPRARPFVRRRSRAQPARSAQGHDGEAVRDLVGASARSDRNAARAPALA
jgi:hypothetical protein